MLRISKERLSQVIRESIEDVIDFGETKPIEGLNGGNVDNMTPYNAEEAQRNRMGVGRMGNPSYDAFKAWREEGLRNGRPNIELSWANYQKEMQNK